MNVSAIARALQTDVESGFSAQAPLPVDGGVEGPGSGGSHGPPQARDGPGAWRPSVDRCLLHSLSFPLLPVLRAGPPLLALGGVFGAAEAPFQQPVSLRFVMKRGASPLPSHPRLPLGAALINQEVALGRGWAGWEGGEGRGLIRKINIHLEI